MTQRYRYIAEVPELLSSNISTTGAYCRNFKQYIYIVRERESHREYNFRRRYWPHHLPSTSPQLHYSAGTPTQDCFQAIPWGSLSVKIDKQIVTNSIYKFSKHDFLATTKKNEGPPMSSSRMAESHTWFYSLLWDSALSYVHFTLLTIRKYQL